MEDNEMELTYYKVVGLMVDALSAEIIVDGNVRDIDEVSKYIKENIKNNENAVWLVLPCSCKI